MRTKKNVECKIGIRHNVYGGNWVEIEVSEDIKTEVACFRLTGEAQVSESIKGFVEVSSGKIEGYIEVFRGEPFNFDPRYEKKP
jgi:hypothetical protein